MASNTITSAKAESLRNRAKEVMEQNTKSVLAMAEVLWETWAYTVTVGGLETNLWTAWGFADWFAYVEVELGIHQSTAANFRRMHEVYNIELKDSFESDAMDGISATKLKILTRIVTKKNINAWLRRAKKMSCCSLEEEVLHELTGHGRPGAVHTFAILCTKAEQKRMRNLVQQAMTDMGVDRPGKALFLMLEEWDTIKHRVKRKLSA